MKLPGKISKEKLQQLVLTGLVTLAAFAATGYFYLGKQWSALCASHQQIAKLTKQLADAEKLATQENQSQEFRAQVQAFVDAQKETMIHGDPLMWVVREITLLSEKHPVQMQTPRGGTKGQHPRQSRLQTYTTRLELAGGYDQIGRFIRDLENRFATAEINSLDLTGNAGSGTIRCNLELTLLLDTLSAASPAGETRTAQRD